MKKEISRQLGKIVAATSIVSPTEFSFDGKTFPASVPTQQNAGVGQTPLVSALKQVLYQYCYVQEFSAGASLETGQMHPNSALVHRLSQANDTRDYWETGWQISEILPSGQIRAVRNERSRLLWAGEFISHHGFGLPPRPGEEISVFFPRESATLQHGFFFAFSQTYLDLTDDRNLMRLYWNIQEQGAPDLMRSISKNLNRFQVPYRFKCLNNSFPFNRTDSAVLFLNKRFYRIVRELLVDIYADLRDLLGSATPLFSKKLAPGLGLAEDPDDGDSFGMNRCRIIAEGLWNAFAKGVRADDARLDEVIKRFEIYSISLEHPYLSAGSVDHYLVPAFETGH